METESPSLIGALGLTGIAFLGLASILVVVMCVRIGLRHRSREADEEESYELNPVESAYLDAELPPAYETVEQADARLAANRMMTRNQFDPFEGDREREKRLRKLVRRQLRAERRRRRKRRQEASSGPPGYEDEPASPSLIPTPEELVASIRATREAHSRGLVDQRAPSSDVEEASDLEDSASEAELQAAEDDAIRRMMNLSPSGSGAVSVSGSRTQSRGMNEQESENDDNSVVQRRESSQDSRSRGKRRDRTASEVFAEESGGSSSRVKTKTKEKDKDRRKSKGKYGNEAGDTEADEVRILSPTAGSSSSGGKKSKYRCLVLKEFVATKEGQLTIKPGDIITVIKTSRKDEGLWQGILDGEKGYFPCTPEYIEVITE